MNPRNSEPTTDAPDEEVPPWPERGPEREPIPLPGPDPAPDTSTVPQDEGTDEGSADLDEPDDPDDRDDLDDQDDPDDRDDLDDQDDPDEDAVDVELSVHEVPEAEVATVDDDVDVELDLAPADEDLLDHTDEPEEPDEADEPEEADDAVVAATAALAAVGAEGLVERPFEEPPAHPLDDTATAADAVGWPLLTDAEAWEERWTTVQASFVDDPGRSIQQADRLVTEAMEEVARLLLARREGLQHRWRTGDGDPPPDTEQLRVAVQGYRALLFGLLATETAEPAAPAAPAAPA